MRVTFPLSKEHMILLLLLLLLLLLSLIRFRAQYTTCFIVTV
jgi:hypothetical protein